MIAGASPSCRQASRIPPAWPVAIQAWPGATCGETRASTSPGKTVRPGQRQISPMRPSTGSTAASGEPQAHVAGRRISSSRKPHHQLRAAQKVGHHRPETVAAQRLAFDDHGVFVEVQGAEAARRTQETLGRLVDRVGPAAQARRDEGTLDGIERLGAVIEAPERGHGAARGGQVQKHLRRCDQDLRIAGGDGVVAPLAR